MTARLERNDGHTLIELTAIVLVLGVFVAGVAPQYGIAVEHGRVNEAAATLHGIWMAQRLYWLEQRTFADDLQGLSDAEFIEDAVGSISTPFAYSITVAGGETFTAQAARNGSDDWSGTISIDETGALAGGTLNGGGTYVEPAAIE